jgi:hypothetical protein
VSARLGGVALVTNNCRLAKLVPNAEVIVAPGTGA